MLHVHKYSWQHNATCFILTSVVNIKEWLLFYVVNLLMLSYWILFVSIDCLNRLLGQNSKNWLWTTTLYNSNWRNFIGRCKTSVIWGCDRCGIVRVGLHVELTCATTALAWSGRKANLPFSSLLRTSSKGSKKRGRPFLTTWERR